MKDIIYHIIDLLDRRCTFTAYLVIAMTFMAYSLTMVAMFHALPKDSESMLYTLIGGLWGSVATIVTFKFGSSAHGQKQTDDLISKDKP